MAEMNKELGKDLKEEISEGGSADDSETDSDITDSSDSDSDYECTACQKKFSGPLPLRQHVKGSKHKKALARKRKERKLEDKDDDEEENGEDQLIPGPYRTCKVCDKEFSGLEPYRMHLKSKIHRQKVLHASILGKVREDGEIDVNKLGDLCLSEKVLPRKPSGVSKAACATSLNKTGDGMEGEDDLDEGEFECKDCDKTFCGLVPYAQHLSSKTHARRVGRKGLLDKITSEIVEDRSEIHPKDVSSLAVEDDVLVCKVCSTSFSGPENAMVHLKSRKHAKQVDKYFKKLEKKRKKAAERKEPDSDTTGSENNEAPGERDEIDNDVPE